MNCFIGLVFCNIWFENAFACWIFLTCWILYLQKKKANKLYIVFSKIHYRLHLYLVSGWFENIRWCDTFVVWINEIYFFCVLKKMPVLSFDFTSPKLLKLCFDVLNCVKLDGVHLYKQVAFWWQISDERSGLNPLSLSNSRNYILKKSGVFPSSKCKIDIKPTMH